jgi:hypothetical protein
MRWLAVLALVVAGPRVALALDRDPEPTHVTARLTGTSIEVTAQFQLEIDGSTVMGLPITIPESAIITRAAATTEGKRHVLDLVDPDEAQKELDVYWDENSPKGNHRWTVRIAAMDNLALVDVVSPSETSNIVLELTLEIPGCFFRDRRYAVMPESWFSRFAAQTDEPTDDVEQACAGVTSIDQRRWISFATPTLARRPLGEARVGAFAGRLPLGHEDLARVEIDLATQLSRVPADLHTAIVIDHSRSLSGFEVESERAVVASYMQRVPAQSRVQVIAYAREAKPLLAAWMPASSARATVDREIRALAPRNGSNVDAAIAEAGRWLARAKGTRRLIIISDSRFARRIEEMTPEELRALLPDKTLVHVVIATASSPGLVPTDASEETLGLAALTEGIAVTAGVDENAKTPLDATMLVRPIQLDRVKIQGRGWQQLDLSNSTCPAEGDALAEGEACTWWGKGTSVASAITVEAFLWGHKITRTLVPDATASRHVARELSIGEHFFDEDLRKRIDRAAFAVNDAWSLMASWGGAAGLSEGGGFGFGRTGSGGSCCGSSTDTIGFSTGARRPPLDLEPQLAPIVERCNVKTPLTIYVETSLEEIVGVEITANNETDAIRRCVEEGVWNLALAIPNAPWSASTTTHFNDT